MKKLYPKLLINILFVTAMRWRWEGIFNFNALTEFYLPRVFFPDMYCWATCSAGLGLGRRMPQILKTSPGPNCILTYKNFHLVTFYAVTPAFKYQNSLQLSHIFCMRLGDLMAVFRKLLIK